MEKGDFHLNIGEVVEIGERVVETPKLKPRAPEQPKAPARREKKKAAFSRPR